MASDKFLSSAIEPAAQQLAAEMQDQLHHRALSAGWPEGVVMSIQVVYEKPTFKITYPDSVKEDIFELEYERTPKGLLSKFMRQYKPQQDRFAGIFSKKVFG